MCYSADLQHKGIKIIVSDCFGVGFDWKDQELKNAVERKDEKIWEILNWMVNGGAALYNEANEFDSDATAYHSSVSGRYNHLSRNYEIKYLKELLENPYLPKRCVDLINSFFDGSLLNSAREEKEVMKNKNNNRAVKGIIYILKSGEYYKIGKTKNLPSRLDTLAVGVRVPFDIQLVHSFKSNDYNSAEAGLHKTFESKRTDGEWFVLSQEDVDFLCSLQDGMV